MRGFQAESLPTHTCGEDFATHSKTSPLADLTLMRHTLALASQSFVPPAGGHSIWFASQHGLDDLAVL